MQREYHGKAPKGLKPGYYLYTTMTPGDGQPSFHYFEDIDAATAAARLLGKDMFYQAFPDARWMRVYLNCN